MEFHCLGFTFITNFNYLRYYLNVNGIEIFNKNYKQNTCYIDKYIHAYIMHSLAPYLKEVVVFQLINNFKIAIFACVLCNKRGTRY